MNQDTLAAEGHGIELVIPDRATMQRFTIFANDSLEQIAMLEQQIQNLRRTRNLLLPPPALRPARCGGATGVRGERIQTSGVMTMIPCALEVKPLPQYRLRLRIHDGLKCSVDLSGELRGRSSSLS